MTFNYSLVRKILVVIVLIGFGAWLMLASIRVFVFTRNAETLIDRISPYNQLGTGSKSILFIGDSFAYGTGATAADGTLAGLIGAYQPEATIINKAKNGTKSADLASRLDSDIDRRYDIIVVIVGSNDIIHPEVNLSASEDSFSTIYAKAASNADHVVAITSGNFKEVSFFLTPLNYYFGYRSHVINEMAKQQTSKFENITYIDGHSIQNKPIKPFALESEDHLHLNDLGNYYWFKTILKETNMLTFERS